MQSCSSLLLHLLLIVTPFLANTHAVPVSSSFDPEFTARNERYLLPFVDDLAIYRESSVGKALIDLARLVDVLPTWLEDMFVPLLIPGSRVTIPLGIEVPIKIPIGKWKIPLPAHFVIENVTFDDLDEFKKLKPAKLLTGNFTWGGDMILKESHVGINAKMFVLGKKISVNASVHLLNPSLHFETIVAFNRTQLCEVWGTVMRSSASCALWPMMIHKDEISGLNITSLRVNITDFDFTLTVSGLGKLDTLLEKELTEVVHASKPEIISMLPRLDEHMASLATNGILKSLPKIQASCDPPVMITTSHLGVPLNYKNLDVLNISRVCLSNNAAFVLEWTYNDCPARVESSQSPRFPVDQSKCMDLNAEIKSANEGDAIRVRAHAVLGLHRLVDPPLRYVPNSNAAAFECSGTTLDYHCTLISVVPINPHIMPQASKICIINHAGFVMEFSTQNARTGAQATSGRYPIDKSQCIEPGSIAGTIEGDQFKIHVHAILGKHQDTSRDIQFYNNGLTVTFECRGTTLNYSCKLLGV